MAVTNNDKANKFANPLNAITVKDTVNCGCDGANQCKANFTYVYDSVGGTVTLTDNSYIQPGDVLDGTGSSGISVTVQDDVQPVSGSAAGAGDDTAPIVVAVGPLDATGTFRIDYAITTFDGCTDTGTLFFTPSIESDATGALDPYNAERV